MAEAMSCNQDLFTCPICLDLLKAPVTIPCGHSYCMGCIKGCWHQEEPKGVYSCPQCRQAFNPRPVLNKNHVFAELVEQIRRTRIQTVASAPVEFAGVGDVHCDVCTGRKLKAVKSCLDCLLCYCENHYKSHNELNPGRKHMMVDATVQLQERICSRHEKPLEVFCRREQTCVCLFCLMDAHKGHDTVSASVGRKEKQTHLGETQKKIQQRILEREKKLQKLRKAVESLKSSAQTVVEDNERIFTEMIHSIETRRSEVKELIRDQEKAEVSWAEGLMKQLEQEIVNLKRRDAELEQLSHTEDHIHFLKTFQSVSNTPETTDVSIIYVNQIPSFETVKKSVTLLKGRLEDFCKEEVIKISATVSKVQTLSPAEPATREEFLQYSCHFTLDPNTAHINLQLSEGNRKVEGRANFQSYPDHPERFDTERQVLCREGVSGRCYWEVEWSGELNIAVSYESINRKRGFSGNAFGCNYQSWRLRLSYCSSSFWHSSQSTELFLVPCSRIGVYVDHRAGTLAFYSISDTMTLLHRIQTTFTHTLYPGFSLNNDCQHL
ncbi:tripartite motif-containing protein 16-like [Sardina pilchardus]|uniref:tripartite motif-containing protein 16-like n=1 Tax=Sardina pilchardus TaxID=27697 RepID=UPI002E12C3A5